VFGTGIGRLAYAGYAVVVPSGSLYNVDSYSGVRVANINRTTVITSYRRAPVVSDRVIPNYNTIKNRYIYNMNLAILAAKPHEAVVSRINYNRLIAPQVRRGISGWEVQQKIAGIGRGEPIRGPQAAQRIQKPRISVRIVPENMVHRPRPDVQFIQRALKAQEKRPQVWPGLQRPGAQPVGTRVPQAASDANAGSARRVSRGKSIGPGVRTGKTAGERQLRQQRSSSRGHRRQGLESRGRQGLQRQQQRRPKTEQPQSLQRVPQIKGPRPRKLQPIPQSRIPRPYLETRRQGFQPDAQRAYPGVP